MQKLENARRNTEPIKNTFTRDVKTICSIGNYDTERDTNVEEAFSEKKQRGSGKERVMEREQRNDMEA